VTELGFLARTREGYDLTAAVYAQQFHDHLHDKPLDRAMLAGFAGSRWRHRLTSAAALVQRRACSQTSGWT
jgi:hypothetical protein